MYKTISQFYPDPFHFFPDILTGYQGNASPVGAINKYDSFQQQYHLIALSSALFFSYCIPFEKNTFFCIDENYGERGSTCYLFENKDTGLDTIRLTSNPNVLGGVFILHHESFVYVPGFGSNNLWIIDLESFQTHSIVSTGSRPHGIYFYQDVFYVPCRGNPNDEDANYIYRYRSQDLSITLDPIDLSVIQPNMGPRHLCFVDHFMYAITEFACTIVRIDLNDFHNTTNTVMIDRASNDTTGGEIREKDGFLYATLRRKGQSGCFLKYDLELNRIGCLIVGTTPRFFNFFDSGTAIVLNQDDQSYTMISLQEWKILSTVTDLRMSPQCFL